MQRISLILLLVSVLLISCKNNPRYYQAEMEDAVRFQLAVANSFYECEDIEEFGEWLEWILALNQQKRADKSCRELLVEQASSNPICEKVVQIYDSQEIILSEPQVVHPDRVWSFYELNSELSFTFTLIPTQNGDMYYKCEVDPDEYQSYITKKFYGTFLNSIDGLGGLWE